MDLAFLPNFLCAIGRQNSAVHAPCMNHLAVSGLVAETRDPWKSNFFWPLEHGSIVSALYREHILEAPHTTTILTFVNWYKTLHAQYILQPSLVSLPTTTTIT